MVNFYFFFSFLLFLSVRPHTILLLLQPKQTSYQGQSPTLCCCNPTVRRARILSRLAIIVVSTKGCVCVCVYFVFVDVGVVFSRVFSGLGDVFPHLRWRTGASTTGYRHLRQAMMMMICAFSLFFSLFSFLYLPPLFLLSRHSVCNNFVFVERTANECLWRDPSLFLSAVSLSIVFIFFHSSIA